MKKRRSKRIILLPSKEERERKKCEERREIDRREKTIVWEKMCCLESWISLAKSAVFQINKFKIQKVCQKSVFVCGQKNSKITMESGACSLF